MHKSEPDYNAFKPNTMQPASNFENHLDLLSDTDDEEERLDCVHDIHGHIDGAEADAEEEEEDDYYNITNDTFKNHQQDTERRGHSQNMDDNMSDNDGDIEDADGLETERQIRPKILNNMNGAVELSHLDMDYYKKKTGQDKGFAVNQTRHRQAGGKNSTKSNRKNPSSFNSLIEIGTQS